MTSPLLLEKTYFTQLILMQGTGSENNISEDELMVDFDYFSHNKIEHHYIVIVSVCVKKEFLENKTYLFMLSQNGVFTVTDPEYFEKEVELMCLTATSILYGSIREMLINMTSRFDEGALSLPAISFNAIVKEKQKKSDGAKKKAKSKSKPAKKKK